MITKHLKQRIEKKENTQTPMITIASILGEG